MIHFATFLGVTKIEKIPMLFAKFVTETNKQLLPSGNCKYEFENFRHTGPLQSDWSKSVLAPPLLITKCLPFFHANSMSLAILSLNYHCLHDLTTIIHRLALPLGACW